MSCSRQNVCVMKVLQQKKFLKEVPRTDYTQRSSSVSLPHIYNPGCAAGLILLLGWFKFTDFIFIIQHEACHNHTNIHCLEYTIPLLL